LVCRVGDVDPGDAPFLFLPGIVVRPRRALLTALSDGRSGVRALLAVCLRGASTRAVLVPSRSGGVKPRLRPGASRLTGVAAVGDVRRS